MLAILGFPFFLILAMSCTFNKSEIKIDPTSSGGGGGGSSSTSSTDYTQVGPFSGQSLSAISTLADGNLSGNITPATYGRSSPYQKKTLTITGNVSWTTSPYIFVRAQTINCSAARTIAANAAAGGSFVTDGTNGAGGGGSGSFDTNDGGAGGSPGNNGSNDNGGVNTPGLGAVDYSGGYSYGSGGSGGAGASAPYGAGNIGGTGATGSFAAGGGGGGSAGAQAGNADGCTNGGGGGGGAGLVVVVAESLQAGCTLTLQANGAGGNYGDCPAGNASGGGGGGGVVWVALRNYTAGTITCSASGGTGANNGVDGQCKIFQINGDLSLTQRTFASSW